MIVYDIFVFITNIDPNSSLSDPLTNIEAHKQRVSISTQNMVSVAENALRSKMVENVILMERINRFDRTEADPSGIKSILSNFGNSEYDRIVSLSEFRNNIFIGKP